MSGVPIKPATTTPYMTRLSSRRPEYKAHRTRAHAHNAISDKVWHGGALCGDAELYVWHGDDWVLLWSGKPGDDVSGKPWKDAELPPAKPRLYLAGPMTGYERWNFDAFEEGAARLRAEGYDVVSPAEADLAIGFDPDAPVEDFTDADYHAAMRRDVAALLTVDGVALLDGWEDSSGARFEVEVAKALGLPYHPLRYFGKAHA